MSNVNGKVTNAVIKSIMEGVDPRKAIDTALDEKSGYHKEKRIRGGKATVVNVKNVKRKVHHTLTADQKMAIKKAHSAQANKKRAKSLRKGNKMGLYQGKARTGMLNLENVNVMSEEDEKCFILNCPACSGAELDFFVDPETNEVDNTVLVCPACGETFVVVPTSEIDTDEDADDKDDEEKDDDKEEEKAEDAAEEEKVEDTAEEEKAEDAAEEEKSEEEKAEEEAPQDESINRKGCGEPEEESGLFFAAE